MHNILMIYLRMQVKKKLNSIATNDKLMIIDLIISLFT